MVCLGPRAVGAVVLLSPPAAPASVSAAVLLVGSPALLREGAPYALIRRRLGGDCAPAVLRRRRPVRSASAEVSCAGPAAALAPVGPKVVVRPAAAPRAWGRPPQRPVLAVTVAIPVSAAGSAGSAGSA